MRRLREVAGVSQGEVNKVVLVTGATGRQGGAVIRHMSRKGWKLLRALTRRAEGPRRAETQRSGN